MNAPKLVELVSHYNASEDHYIGHHHPIEATSKDQQFCAGGCGYLISNSLMRKIHSRLLEPFTSSNSSDIQLGYLVQNITGAVRICTNEIHPDKFVFHERNVQQKYSKAHFDTNTAIGFSGQNAELYRILANSVAWHQVTAVSMYHYEALYTGMNEYARNLIPVLHSGNATHGNGSSVVSSTNTVKTTRLRRN